MILHIKNLAHIKSAEIDLGKNLIIFTGPNNSGKTYLAYAIFGLFKIAQSTSLGQTQLFSSFISHQDLEGTTIDIQEFIKHTVTLGTNNLKKQLKSGLPDIFSIEDTITFEAFDIDIKISIEKLLEEIRPLEIDDHHEYDGRRVRITKKENSYLWTISYYNQTSSEAFVKLYEIDIASKILFRLYFQSLFNNPYIAPAERIAINIFSKELSIQRNMLVDELLRLKNKKSGNPLDYLSRRAIRYPLPIRECLSIAEDLETLQKNKSNYAFLADAIEKEMLGGKIKISSEGEVQFRPAKNGNKSLGIHISSSIVKSLSSLVFYFRHLAQEHDFIIIDEPELNLHPDNQRKIARIIAHIVGVGFKVLISTHSDYIIREVNNLIMLGAMSDKGAQSKLMRKYGYRKEELLSYAEVGAYILESGSLQSIEVSDLGIEIQAIDTVINALNNSSEEIYITLTDEKL